MKNLTLHIKKINTVVIFKILLFVLFLFLNFSKVHAAKHDLDWFWFLYEQESSYEFDTFVFRPFYMSHFNKKNNKRYQASLPPFIYWKYTTKRKEERHWLLGFSSDVNYLHSNKVYDYDFGFFPFIYYGSSVEKKDQYFMLWPLGGTLKGKLAHDRISPWVFPGVALFYYYPPSSIYMGVAYLFVSMIPAYVSYDWKDYHAQAILWPLIQWGSSPKRKDFRILPFYAHNYKKDAYDNYSYLFFINYQKTFLSKKKTQTTFFVVPLFARRWSSSHSTSASTLLWPFFSWGYNKREGNLEINFPWPLFQYRRSEKPFVRKKIFFPFYGYYEKQKRKTEFITPLYFTLKENLSNLKSEYYISFFIIWYFKRDYKRSPSTYYGNSWRYFKIWPLFNYEYNDKGAFSFRTLSLLPFRDPDGYEKMYSPFWSLIEYSRTADGIKRFGLLLRTYYQYWGDDFLKIKVPLIFSYYSYNNRVAEFKFILSMFGYEWNNKGKYISLFWIPIKIGEGRTDVAVNVEKEKLEKENNNKYINQDYYYALINKNNYNIQKYEQSFTLFKKNVF